MTARYEKALVVTDTVETQAAALGLLVRLLHARGYTQLRSRLNFRGDSYLGTQELWIEYADPPPPEPAGGLSRWLRWVMPGAWRK